MSDVLAWYDLPTRVWDQLVTAIEPCTRHGQTRVDKRRAFKLVILELQRLANEPTSRKALYIDLMIKNGLPALDANTDDELNAMLRNAKSNFSLIAEETKHSDPWQVRVHVGQRKKNA